MPTPPYSLIKQAGDTYYLAGHTGVLQQEGTIAPTIAQQTEDCLQNISKTLTGVGLTMKEIVKTTVFLKNIDDFAAMNNVYATFFEAPYPARSTVEVACLPKIAINGTVLIEIEAVAVRHG